MLRRICSEERGRRKKVEKMGWMESHHGIEKIKKLILEISKLRREVMATKAEVLQAIADEKAQVTVGLEKLDAQIKELKDQLAAGAAVTAAELDEIQTAVHDIFVPPVVE